MLENNASAHFLFLELPWWFIITWAIYSISVFLSSDLRRTICNYYIFDSIPNVFVTLGLLGTFMGITYGLLNFDTSPEAIKESIKSLLDGLKLALTTSIVGITASLLFSKIVKIYQNNRFIEEPQSPELEQLILLNKQFESFNSKQYNAVVHALQDVLEDFNDVFKSFIGELVQQNFDKLTESIDQLITWQKDYKEEIITIKEAYSDLNKKHQQLVSNTEEWVNTLKEISGQSSQLQKIVDEFNEAFHENGNLSQVLNKIKAATVDLQNASSNFNVLSNRMTDATAAINNTSNNVKNWTHEIQQVANTTASIAGHFDQIRKVSLIDMREEFNKDLARTLASLDKLMKAYVENLETRRVNQR